jgi:Tol biopolymer transport system component
MYRNEKGRRTQPIILVNIDTHEETVLFDILSKAAMSPDGKWIAYIDVVPGKMGSGLYLSRLDQSEKRLLIQLGHINFSSTTWSPDGKWIGFSIQDNATFIPTNGAAIINPESCQVYPLNIDEIEVLREWRNP